MPGVERDRARRGRAARLARRRDAGGPLDRRPRQGATASASTSFAGARGRRSSPSPPQTRMSGVDIDGDQPAQGRRRRDRATGSRPRAASAPAELRAALDRVGREGGTPLAVARDSQVLGVVYLKDIVKEGMSERFDQLRAMGIRTVMVTGDNRLTAAKIADEAGVDDFLAEATPEAKLELITAAAGRGPAGRDDRRRHQRRPGAGPGRRRRGDEHRHPGRARGRATWSTSTPTRRS